MRQIREHLLALRALIGVLLFTAIAAALVLVGSFFEPWGGKRSYRRVMPSWARLMLWLGGVDLTVHSEIELTEGSGPYIVVLNHQSHYDIPTMVAAVPLQLRFVGKNSLGKIPIFGHAARRVGCVFIKREDSQDSVAGMKRAGETLKRTGMSIVVAPEGTRSPDGRLLPFKKGAFVMAIEMGVPVLPVTISGTRQILPKKSLYIRRGKVTATIHRPVLVDGLSYDDRDELSDRVRTIMASALDRG